MPKERKVYNQVGHQIATLFVPTVNERVTDQKEQELDKELAKAKELNAKLEKLIDQN